MRIPEPSASFWLTTRFVLWIALVLVSLIGHFQRAAQRHGFLGAVLLFAFVFLIIESLWRADRRLRHRNGIPWVSRLYGSIAWLTLATLAVAAWLIVN
jgi:hypothetical protein